MNEDFNIEAYLRCDCAQVGNQTCDRCAMRLHINGLTRGLERWRQVVREARAYDTESNKRGSRHFREEARFVLPDPDAREVSATQVSTPEMLAPKSSDGG